MEHIPAISDQRQMSLRGGGVAALLPIGESPLPGGGLAPPAGTFTRMASQILIEHGETRLARRLRHNRYKIALAIAALEGILVLAGVIPWWIVVLLALGRSPATSAGGGSTKPGRARRHLDGGGPQLVVVLVPILAGLVVVLAAVVVVLLAALALAALLLDRR